jgi:release factor glutamine methyltransferase
MSTPEGAWTIAALLEWTTSFFHRSGIPDGRRDAEILLAKALNLTRSALLTHPEQSVAAAHRAEFRRMVQSRGKRVPVAYIIGEREFMGLPFIVNRHTLIPRPETEHLVEEALRCIAPTLPSTVCDIGTGSGCIALSIAHASPHAVVYATDISLPALETALHNAAILGLAHRVCFKHGDLLAALRNERLEGSVDVLVSNPPYIAEDERGSLEPELDSEPAQALYAADGGLACYRRLAGEAAGYVRDGGFLVFELNAGKSREIQQVVAAAGFEIQRITKDYAGHERVLTAQRGR